MTRLKWIAGVIAISLCLSARATSAPEVNERLGSLEYRYEFSVPAARGRFQPGLALEYSSKNTNDAGMGVGWVLTGERVEKVVSNGTTRYFHVRGEARTLLVSSAARDGTGYYVPDVEDRYQSFRQLNSGGLDSGWEAVDANGTRYTFSSRIYIEGYQDVWHLSAVTDAEQNRATYTYAVSTPLKVVSIAYNYYDADNPSSTAAVPLASTAFASQVELEYALPDGTLKNVRVKNRGSLGLVTVRRYAISYTTASTGERVLQSITEIGKEAGLTLTPTAFEYASPVAPSQPSAIVTPSGGRYSFVYGNSSTFGDGPGNARFVVTSATSTGPAIVSNTTTYWYASPHVGNAWFDGTPEYRGFRRSWAQGSGDNIVRSVWWETFSPAFIGEAAQVEWGAPLSSGTSATPPAYAAFRRNTIEHTAHSIGGGCIAPTTVSDGVNHAATITASDFPVTKFVSKERTATFIDGLEIAGEKTIVCNDVDSYGNVKARRVDPDVRRAQDEFSERTTFMVAGNPAIACKDCVDTVATVAGSDELLSYARYEYHPTWQPSMVRMKESAEATELVVRTWSYNGNGTLRSKTDGAATYEYEYDLPFQLRIARAYVSAGTKKLVTDVAFDDYGFPSTVTGPYVLGGAGSMPQRGIRYDDLGRARALSRRAITGATIFEAVAAFEYFDFSGSTPASVKVHEFTAPIAYTEPSIPQTADVRQRTVFVDAHGRPVQLRERLGGTGTGDPMAHISQNLSGYRVSNVVIYDGAGRVAATLDPFYSSSGAYVDYRTQNVDNLHTGDPGGLSSALHVRVRAYDAQGREVCDAYRVMASQSMIPTLAACVSSFAEDSNYTRAVMTAYRGLVSNGVNYLGVKKIPAENNLGTMDGPESFFDASWRLRWTADVDQNRTTYVYDLLGRVTGIVRDVADLSKPSITTSISYDMMGRVSQRNDPNVGTRNWRYDPQGQLWKIEMPARTLEASGIRARDYVQFAYDVGRPSTIEFCTASEVISGGTYVVQNGCRTESALFYDEPYKSDPIYENVAGRLSWADKQGATTIAFGYNDEGVTVRREQQFAGLPASANTFTSTEATLFDGQAIYSDFESPYGGFEYQLYYDSMRRPVQLDSGGTTYWRAPAQLTTGAYDAMGRVADVDLDSSRVHATWQYAPTSGLENAARVQLGTSDLVHVALMTYHGRRLISYKDEIGQTLHRYWYGDAGRLKAAFTTVDEGATSPLKQDLRACVSFNVSRRPDGYAYFGPGPSFGNIERYRDQAVSPARDDQYDYRGAGIDTASPPGPDAPTSIESASFTTPLLYDASGRLKSKALGAETFEYDLANRLERITRNGVVDEVLSYDPTGKLFARFTGGKVTYYLSDQATVSATALPGCAGPGCAVDESTVTVDVHLLVGSRRIATVRALPTATGRTLYYYRDRLESVVATSLGGGQAGAQYRYSVFGAVSVAQQDSGDARSDLGFAGGLRLSGGLLLMGARVYDPSLRQFLQPDGREPMSYTYAAGDPVNAVDPTGASPVTIERREARRVAISGHAFGDHRLGLESYAEIRGILAALATKRVPAIYESGTPLPDEVNGGVGGSPPEPPQPPEPDRPDGGWEEIVVVGERQPSANEPFFLTRASPTMGAEPGELGHRARDVLAHGLFEVLRSGPMRFAAQATVGEVSISFGQGLVVTSAGEVALPAIWSSLPRAVAGAFGGGIVMGIGVEIEVYIYDREFESLANDIYTVLSRGRY